MNFLNCQELPLFHFSQLLILGVMGKFLTWIFFHQWIPPALDANRCFHWMQLVGAWAWNGFLPISQRGQRMGLDLLPKT